jgi:superfamily II DNA or RNA helicase
MAGTFAEIAETIGPSYSTTDDVVNRFYVPLLARAHSYDRVAGYFTSWGLAVAARGLAEFVNGSGRMRLIVGAQLDADDIAALEYGADLAQVVEERLSAGSLWEDLDEVRSHRLHLLAWLAREGRLEIKVGVPQRPDGRLVPATETTDYFHDKFGIFTDGDGQRVAFVGSNNDTMHGWMGNSESFSVVPEWSPGWSWNGIDLADRFERYWNNEHSPEWSIIPLSSAVRDTLLRVSEVTGPPAGPDPEEISVEESQTKPEDIIADGDLDVAQIDIHELLDQPIHFPFSGVMSAGVLPLPHQMAVIDRAVRTFPRGYLFGDEVGLGKTIEVGLTVRELILSHQIERVLLLVPAAVLTQWQEELVEKVALWVPRWSDGNWVWPDGTETAPRPGDPWASTEPIVLVSSHLARRSDQRARLLAGAPWDLVVVDEAHHARRKSGVSSGSPNNLLALLQDLHHEGGWRALYLASATPMQMYPHEAWDLIELFDLPGWWSDSAEKFEAYFRELGYEWPRRQWNLLAHMVRDNFSDPNSEPNVALDLEIVSTVKGPDRISIISGFGSRSRVAIEDRLYTADGDVIRANKQWITPIGKKPELASLVTAWLYTNNPMRDRVFRNTRDTLRAYRSAGIWPVDATIPDRIVDDRLVEMSPAEEVLYCQVQNYIRTKYNQAALLSGRERNAIGFILTVYRRRLTSSFQAIERSLRRRIAALEGQINPKFLLTEDDSILDDSAPEITDAMQAWALDDEVHDLRKLADALGVIASTDESKMLRLHQIVDDALAGGHQTVLIFTQYADTMEYVRDRLDAIYKGRVIGYSSSGGTIRNPTTGEWDNLTKRQTKELFAAGDQVKVLVGTDTLSEGLNLQTCGRLVNYDLPWNFTRVEQRIGRVDRIGGLARVEVTNLLYDGTVETTVYRRLIETFGGFNAVVGIAQPVLGQIENVIKSASLVDQCEDGSASVLQSRATLFDDDTDQLTLDDAVASIIAAANGASARTLAVLDEHGSPVGGVTWPEAKNLEDFRDALFNTPNGLGALQPTDTPGLWAVDVDGNSHMITFDRKILLALAPDVELLTWGSPLLTRMIPSTRSV